jgi:hypothetical protein
MNETSNSLFSRLVCGLAIMALSISPILASSDTLDLEVTFIGDREILLQDAHKQLHWPEPVNLKTTKPTFTYSMLPKRMNVQPEWSKNGPIRLHVSEPLRRLYKGHIQAGLGNFISPTLDFSYTDLRSKEGSWGLRGSHVSSQGGYADNDSIDDVFSSSSFTGWGKRFIGTESVEIIGNYARQHVSFFGGNPSISVGNESIERTYQVWGTQLDVHNFETKNQHLQHRLKAAYQFLKEGPLQEHNIDLELSLKLNPDSSKANGSSGIQQLPISLTLHTNVDRLNRLVEGAESPTSRQAIFDFHPQIDHTFGNIQTRAGVAFWIDAQGNKPLLVVPELEVSTSLMRGLFIPYLKADGGVHQNRYQTLLQANPFASDQTPDYMNTYQKIHLQAGVRGSITKAFTFNLSAHHQICDQFLLWGSDTLSARGETFAPQYADMNITSIQADGSWRMNETCTLTGQIKQNNYHFEDDEAPHLQPWNLPTLQTKLGAVYTWQEKIRLSSQLDILTGRNGLQTWATESESTEVYNGEQWIGFETALGASTQWDIQLEYLYNGRLSGWIHLHNVLNQPNLFLPGYNSQKFRFQMGMNYAF